MLLKCIGRLIVEAQDRKEKSKYRNELLKNGHKSLQKNMEKVMIIVNLQVFVGFICVFQYWAQWAQY